MKAEVTQVGIDYVESDKFGGIDLTLIPENEEEKELFIKIATRHAKLADEERCGEVAVITYASSDPAGKDIKLEISFPK